MQGRVVRSQTDYILGSVRRIFQNVAVQEPRHNYDHFMVMGCLCGASPRETLLTSGAGHTPFTPPGRQIRTRADKLFAKLWRAVPKTDKRTVQHNSWIAAETWRLINKRVSTRREPGRDQRRLRRLGRAIRELLKEDRPRQVTAAG